MADIQKKLLFTPGPLTTSDTVKKAMLTDVGSRDYEFVTAVKDISNELLRIGHVSIDTGYECVIIQGSGTFGVESVVSSALGEKDCLLVLANGAYGERIIKMAKIHKIKLHERRFEEDEIVSPEAVALYLEEHPEVTHVACIHSETTTGLINPIAAIGKVCRDLKKVFIVDAMSSFGGMDIDISQWHIDFLLSSSNKCIEGVPGFAFAICRRTELQKAKGQARSLSLDLYEQWAGLKANGQFRFTPPTLSIMAFRQALRELDSEGGILAREQRYKTNKKILDKGMAALGFKAYLRPQIQGHIISSFLYPTDANFHFEDFYKKLNDRGFIIYPGKLSKTEAFRIGNIGQIFPADVEALLVAIEQVLEEEKVVLTI